jgi:hypothetical protein
MVNSCAVYGCCTRTDIVREHLEDTLRICDVMCKGSIVGACILFLQYRSFLMIYDNHNITI